MRDKAATTYRPPAIQVFFVTFVLGALTGVAITLVFVLLGFPVPGVLSYTFLQMLSIVYLWAIVAAGCIVWAFSITISPSGIRGRTFWATMRTLEWDEAVGAAPTNVAGLRFLRVYSVEGGPPIWVPLFLKHRHAFRGEVSAFVGNDHPLAKGMTP